jgi:ATP-dependent DNA helicase RecQ
MLIYKHYPAIEFTNRFCCDRHDNGFELDDFFPGKLQVENPILFINLTAGTTLRARNRPVKEREPLKAILYAWRSREHRNDPLRGVRQISWILTDAEIEIICKTPRKSLENVDQLQTLLGARSDWMDEWGQKIVDEVCLFNANNNSA